MTRYRHRCTTRTLIRITISITRHSILITVRGQFHTVSHFSNRATEMKEYFRARGYPDELVSNHLRKVPTTCSSLLKSTPTSYDDSTNTKVPLVLTYNPFNVGIRRILLDNFNILSSDPEARRIFPEPLLVSYRREGNLGDIFVHSTDALPSLTDADSFSCRRPRCHACKHITAQTFLQGRRAHITSVTTSPVSLRMLCIAFPVVAAIAFTSGRPEGDYGNVSANTSAVFETDRAVSHS